jgi:thiol-disulfide isomerase/thioredoxin
VKRTVIILAVVVLAVATMLFVGARLSHTAANSSVASGLAPDFELKTLDGKLTHLSDYRGKAVLLNFWATWCGPCKIEMPWLVELNKQYAPQGLVVLGVAMDDDADKKDSVQKDIRAFTTEMAVDYPILMGSGKVADNYGGVQFLPEIFYIDRNGKIVEHAIGLKGHSEIEDNIKKIVASQVAAK